MISVSMSFRMLTFFPIKTSLDSQFLSVKCLMKSCGAGNAHILANELYKSSDVNSEN